MPADGDGATPTQRGGALLYLAIAALVILLGLPALIWLVRTWLSNPYYTHGFLVLPIAALLAWRQGRHVRAEPREGGHWAGAAVALLCLAAYVWSAAWQSYAAAAAALVGLVSGILLYLEGWARLRRWLFPLFFLLLAIPLPIVDRASPWLASFTARWATALVRLLGVAAEQQGGEITMPGTAFVVGAPCSGVRSLVAMIALALLWLYLVQGRPLAKAGLLLAAVPLVALGNVLRIAILLLVARSFGSDAAMRYYHGWASPVLFLLVTGLFLLLGKALGCSQLRDDLF